MLGIKGGIKGAWRRGCGLFPRMPCFCGCPIAGRRDGRDFKRDWLLTAWTFCAFHFMLCPGL